MDIKEKIKLMEEESLLQTDQDKKYIPEKEGSLGLLALGYRGIVAWKKAIEKIQN
jgi:hypothetical protein